MNCVHFGETSNLNQIPDNLVTAVHRQTGNISKHVSVDGCLEVAFPEVESCFEIVQRSWILGNIFVNIFIHVPVTILIKHVKQECELFINVSPVAFVVQCSLQRQQQAVFTWVPWNKDLRSHSSQSQRTQIIRWTNQNSKQIYVAVPKSGKTWFNFQLYFEKVGPGAFIFKPCVRIGPGLRYNFLVALKWIAPHQPIKCKIGCFKCEISKFKN